MPGPLPKCEGTHGAYSDLMHVQLRSTEESEPCPREPFTNKGLELMGNWGWYSVYPLEVAGFSSFWISLCLLQILYLESPFTQTTSGKSLPQIQSSTEADPGSGV